MHYICCMCAEYTVCSVHTVQFGKCHPTSSVQPPVLIRVSGYVTVLQGKQWG